MPAPFGVMGELSVIIFQDGQHAAEGGYNYPPDVVTPLKVAKVVVVKNGTAGGNPTVDFLMEDEDGRQYVVIMTGALLKAIPC